MNRVGTRLEVFHHTGLTPTGEKRYTHVATVNVPEDLTPDQGLEYAFTQTNHIEHSWTENASLVPYVEQARSTDLGDAVMEPDGGIFRLTDKGWRPAPHLLGRIFTVVQQHYSHLLKARD